MMRNVMILLVAGFWATCALPALAESPISVHLVDLPSDEGKIFIMLCTREAYDNNGEGCERGQVTPSRREASYVFENVPPGEYAIQAIHDENNNDEFDRKWYGKPKEAYGMSTNPEPRWGRPKFDDGVFTHGKEPSSFEIVMLGGKR